VTVCTQLGSCLFGAIQNGEMLANDAGRMIHDTWREIPIYYPGIELDVMQIMPNHIVVHQNSEPATPEVDSYFCSGDFICFCIQFSFENVSILWTVEAH
jgi:REP element-mobilizing transposase RayT